MVYEVKLLTKPNISMANWCVENCKGLWFGTDKSQFWSFQLELDAMAFKLRWI